LASADGDNHQGIFMMRNRVTLVSLLAGIALFSGTTQLYAQAAREEGHLLMATQVLEELSATPDTFIPDRLLDRAYAIAVVPDVTKVAFIAGGRRGKGVMVVRDKNGRFSNPVFIALTGGSFGWQAGVQSTDIVLVFTTPGSKASPVARSRWVRTRRSRPVQLDGRPPSPRIPILTLRSTPTRATAAYSPVSPWTAAYCRSIAAPMRSSTKSPALQLRTS